MAGIINVSKERIDIVLESLTKIGTQNDKMQEATKIGSKIWHQHEDIDDCVHEAIAAIETYGDD